MIEIRSLTIRKSGKYILRNVNMRVEKGEFVAIVGPNGAGKTTLIKSILGLEEPFSGFVKVNGMSPKDAVKTKSLKIGYLPQRAIVNWSMPLRVIDVVLMEKIRFFGLFRKRSKSDINEAMEWLDAFGVKDVAYYYIRELSGGQQQRVSLARCMVNNPDLLILDEPNTAVDAVYNFKMYKILKRISEERKVTIVMVSHDIGAVTTYVDKIMCLNVKLYCHGSPSSIDYSQMLKSVYGDNIGILIHGEQCKNCPLSGDKRC